MILKSRKTTGPFQVRILIVESSHTFVLSISIFFEKKGIDVVDASTLEDCLKILQTNRFDAILLDLSLPDCTGLEVFYQVKRIDADCPIVIFTEIGEEDLAHGAIEKGADGHIVKELASNDSIFRRLEYAIEKNKAEQLLRKSEKRLRIILENSYDAFISADDNWSITDWNWKAQKTFGWSKEEIIGKPLSSIVPYHLRVHYAKTIEEQWAQTSGNLLRGHYEFIAADKEGFEFNIEFVIFKIIEDEDYMYCVFVRDISERKKLEEELERLVDERTEALLKSNEELRQFAKIASHDLQEPLRAVQGFANLLLENTKGNLDKDSEEFVGYILDGTKRMQNLIQSVLTHSNIDSTDSSTQATKCNLVMEDVLNDLMSPIHETKAIFEIDDLPEVAVERSHLHQLFLNLVSNALKYRSEKRPHVVVKVDQSGDMWLFSVRDNGIGFNPKYSDKIFDMFARLHGKTQYTGTGMGLAICKRIVTSHGGTISVESEPGHGSIFLFTLPAVQNSDKELNNGEKN